METPKEIKQSETATTVESQHNTKKETTGSDNVILVGSKPFMNYVTAVVVQFTTKGADKVVIKSRGKFISKAVDVAEVSRLSLIHI